MNGYKVYNKRKYDHGRYGWAEAATEWIWAIDVILNLGWFIPAIIIRPDKWLVLILGVIFSLWMVPVILSLSIYALEEIVYTFIHPKKGLKNIYYLVIGILYAVFIDLPRWIITTIWDIIKSLVKLFQFKFDD